MKSVSERVELDEGWGQTNAGERLYVVIPKHAREAFLRRVRDAGKSDAETGDDYVTGANVELLRGVADWNFDDDAGAKLPLVSEIDPKMLGWHGADEKLKTKLRDTVGACPVGLFGLLGNRFAGRTVPTPGDESGN